MSALFLHTESPTLIHVKTIAYYLYTMHLFTMTCLDLCTKCSVGIVTSVEFESFLNNFRLAEVLRSHRRHTLVDTVEVTYSSYNYASWALDGIFLYVNFQDQHTASRLSILSILYH